MRRRWPELAVAALTVVLAFPTSLYREVGVDSSWAAGLQMASSRNLVFGKQVVFTYGPLGYLGNPALYVPRPGVLSILFNVALTFALAYVTMRLLRTRFPTWVAAILAVVVVVIARREAAAPVLVMLAVTWAIWWVLRGRTTLGPVIAMGVVFGPTVLIKFSCVECVVVLGVAVAVAAFLDGGVRLAIRHGATFVVVSIGSLVVTWLLIGQPISALPSWFSGSLQVAQGYDDAMGLPLGDVHWIYPVGALLLALAVSVVCTVSGLSTRVRAGVLIVVVTTALMSYKESFVRQSGFAYFLVGVAVALSLVPLLDRRLSLAALAVAIVPVLVLTADYNRLLDVRPHLSAMRTFKSFVVSSDYRSDALVAERSRAVEGYRVPVAMLDTVAGHTVDIQPEAMLVAYGDPRLQWDPSPVLQSYSAYTDALDAMNARFLARSDAPEFVLRQPGIAIDHRLGRFESPGATLALMCHYREEQSSGGWQLFARSENRCGAPRKLKRVETALGQRVPVPVPTAPNRIVVAGFHGLASSMSDRLQSLVASGVQLWLGTDQWHRFVQGTQGDAHIVSMPNCAVEALDGSAPSNISSLAMSDQAPEAGSVPGPGDVETGGHDAYRVEFSEISFRC